jgi:aminopeptidase N
MKTDSTPNIIKLEEYKAPNFFITNIELTFDLDDKKTLVKSKMQVSRNGNHREALILNGEELNLVSVKLDGESKNSKDVETAGDKLIIQTDKNQFVLEIENTMNPEDNKTLDGLYKSGSIFCTQCEPEGFRRITYYVDRPDNMAVFKTKIIADKKSYPILLSNGNPIAKGDLENGKHFVTWEDPFKKPSYLFALVAGDLGVIRDHFVTMTGRKILLEIYCDKGNEDKCHYAMESLKKSMKWDEDRFGLEYDLDIYMIVAVDAFNMGAMENKGLNIFNSAYVLANPKTATDGNFYGIESVIGHEYFHNWTGNRITCRDWFQLTLKEGLTVFRDQEFSADMNSRDVERIVSVGRLRSAQFPEDQGPTTHPIKPSTYIEINNFYTATVYEKGAEVIRMLQTLLGVDGFRKGMDKYFELFDGKAVRTEDFLHSMSVANNHYDLSQFQNWYCQNGTPIVHAAGSYDGALKKYTLTLKQELPKNTIKNAKPFHMPIIVGLLDSHGNELISKTLELKKEVETFVFESINSKPVASINRNFSAPIKLVSDHSFEENLFLMAHDTDSFNRYEASQVVSTKIINELIIDLKNGRPLTLNPKYIEAYGHILTDDTIDEAYKALVMTLPEELIIHQEQNPILYKETNVVHEFIKEQLALAHEELLLKMYNNLNEINEYKVDSASMGKRDLKGKCRLLLMSIPNHKYESIVFDRFKEASNMTDELGDLSDLIQVNSRFKDEAVLKFYNKWKHETLVMQKWLSVQASASYDDVFHLVLELEKNSVYNKSVPNLVRSLIGAFSANKLQFNHESGRGYQLVAERILELDSLNPQMASRLASQFKDYKRLPINLKKLMEVELNKIMTTKNLSKNVYEIVSKILEV